MTREVPSRRESARTEVHTLEVVWFSLADLVGLRTPTSFNWTGRERRARRSEGYGGGGAATKKGRDKCRANGRLYRREVFCHIIHYVL